MNKDMEEERKSIGNYDFSLVEQEILGFWKNKRIYEQVKINNKGKKVFYYLDGPPYTSGRIHLGHVWGKSLRDSLLRYKRAKGFDVFDRAGFDMHGLPTEHKAEEKLGIKHKEDIPQFGIAKFVEECRNISIENMNQMITDFKNFGVWMDFDNAYQPIKTEFIEGVWWLIKKAHENKRLYQGEKVMHWCQSCATALAKHELEYKNVTDTSIFIKFKVKNSKNEYLIVWTTTPWTIAYNLAVMANPELDYIKAKVGNEIWILAKGLAGSFIQGLLGKNLEIIDEFKGTELEGLEYEHPFYNLLKEHYDRIKKNANKTHTVILSEEYVDLSAGTGLVHSAPGCGPEDFEACRKYKIPPFNNLDEEGNYPEDMGEMSELNAKADSKSFIELLKRENALIEKSPVEHEYAHCWRCHNPVIFRLTTQWFFKVEDLIEEMRELNKKVFWQPDWGGKKQFDSWIANLRDNSITKQRYWGVPLPIWQCSKCKSYIVISSVEEMAKHSINGFVPGDLHKPYIDEVEMKCKCGEVMYRNPDILDVWIDAGTVSWNALDYPHSTHLFEKIFPPDFILEGKDQIRGWFNLLLVCSMISIGKPSYKAVYMHGMINDALGRKMSKSLGNYILPEEDAKQFGIDAMRYYMISGANPGMDLNYNENDLKIKYRNLTVLWNVHKYLIDYCNLFGINPSKIDDKILMPGTEEKYILSKLNSTIKKATELFEEYRIDEVPILLEELFLELSRTYIKLTREKMQEEKELVINTISKVLFESLKMLTPFVPFITEKIYQNMRHAFELELESISFYPWPEANESLINPDVEKSFVFMSSLIQNSLSLREKIGLGVRWPLKEMIVVTKDESLALAVNNLEDLIKTQLNVKEVKVLPKLDKIEEEIQFDFKRIEKEFKERAAQIIAKLTMDSPKIFFRHIQEDGKYFITVGDEEIEIKKEHLIVTRDVQYPYVEAEIENGYVYLNQERTEELEAEGYAREIMRRVQGLRKKAGLTKEDRIVLFVKANEELVSMIKKHENSIKEKVGAEKIDIDYEGPAKKHAHNTEEKIKNYTIEIFFDKV